MRNELKLGLYGVLVVAASVFGFLSISNYQRLMSVSGEATQPSPTEVLALNQEENAATSRGYARMLGFGVVFFASILGLGLLIGHDVSHMMGNRVLKGMYNDEGEGMADPDYEAAEQEWANGHHLEAIRLMREYLLKNPREQHVALRIAEIYEKDLLNPLAAALEYEEVLKHKLPEERWGWSAIHLCNLYSKLNQSDKAIALLRRIDSEHPQTAAAEKARKRLAELGIPTLAEEAAAQEQAEAPPPAPPSGPQLPPGFTLKKS
jgi:hypothetical protein